MGLDVTTTPTVGDSTKRSEYVRLQSNDKALRQGAVYLGGDLRDFIASTSYVRAPNSFQREIDGTELAGRTVKLELNLVARMASGAAWSGSATCTVRLLRSDGSVVASSETATLISSEALVITASTTLTLAASIDTYYWEIKTSDAAREVAGLMTVSIR